MRGGTTKLPHRQSLQRRATQDAYCALAALSPNMPYAFTSLATPTVAERCTQRTLSTLHREILTVGALRCTQLLILIHECSWADLISRTVLQHESASGKSCMGRRADMEKHQFASLPGPCVLPAPAGFRTILPTLPTLPTLPVSVQVMTLAGFQQQSEIKREVHGGGTNLSAKRSHLKRQLKVPTKLQGHHDDHHHQVQGDEREPNAGGENKIYKKGLFEKRFQQLVFLSPQPQIP